MAAILFISNQHFCVLMSKLPWFCRPYNRVESSNQVDNHFEKTMCGVGVGGFSSRKLQELSFTLVLFPSVFTFSGRFSLYSTLDFNSMSSQVINYTKNFDVLPSVTPLENVHHPLMSFRI